MGLNPEVMFGRERGNDGTIVPPPFEEIELTWNEGHVANALERKAHKMRTVQYVYDLLPYNDKINLISNVITSVADAQTADDFVGYHIGKKDGVSGALAYTLSDEDLADISEREKNTILREMNKRAASFWPWLLLVDPKKVLPNAISPTDQNAEAYKKRYDAMVRVRDDFPSLVYDFQDQYHDLAVGIGLHPSQPKLETVPNQRLINADVRWLGSELEFLHLITDVAADINSNKPTIEGNPVDIAVNIHMGMIARARSEYGQYQPSVLQEALERKFRGNKEKVSKLEQAKLWQNKDDLVTMMVDRGPRDVVRLHHSLFQAVGDSTAENYHMEQQLLWIQQEIKRIMRVV